jgi:hypothetical protein
MLGLAKGFVIAIIVSVIVAIGTDTWTNGLYVIIPYIVIKIIWVFLTGKIER